MPRKTSVKKTTEKKRKSKKGSKKGSKKHTIGRKRKVQTGGNLCPECRGNLNITTTGVLVCNNSSCGWRSDAE